MIEFPRILISGQYFHTNSGGGITLSNLFSDWDKDKIAATASFITNPSFEVCQNYYQLGSSEQKLRFPFNLKSGSNLYSSGRVKNEVNFSGKTDIPELKKAFYRKLYDTILFSTGLIHYRNSFILSPDFLKWVNSFNPEILYTQLSSFEEMRIVETLKGALDIPLVIHIMDDWPSTISNRYFPKLIWQRIINSKLKRLFSEAKVLLSISDPMSQEYFNRYGLTFMPFHNPIDTKIWLAHSRKDCSVNVKNIKILYSGRIGTGISHSLIDVAEAIGSMNSKGGNIKLYIQSPTEEHEILNVLRTYECIEINPPVDYNKIPEIFSCADILLLANDFDDKAITFLKFSMPTKASEYMISGTPILVYSAEETAVTKFFTLNECGYCVSHKNMDELITGISTLINDQAYRKKISRNSIITASERFDAEKVRMEFLNVFIDATKDGKLASMD